MEDIHIHRINLFKGVTKPKQEFSGFGKADKINGIGLSLVSVLLAVGLITALGAYAAIQMGIGAQQAHVPNMEMNEGTKQAIAVFSVITGGIGGLIGVGIVMLIATLIFLIFFRDIGFAKLFTVEIYLQFIGLISGIVTILLLLVFQTNFQSFLSLGVFTRLLTDNLFVNTFFGGISIFLIWKLYVQIQAYRNATEKSMTYIVWVLILLNLVYLLGAAGFAVLGQNIAEQFQQMQQIPTP